MHLDAALQIRIIHHPYGKSTRDRQALLRDFRLEVAAAGRPIDGITEERLDAALQRAADMALLVS